MILQRQSSPALSINLPNQHITPQSNHFVAKHNDSSHNAFDTHARSDLIIMSKIRFFDLPYEIRLSMYELILPADRVFTHSSRVLPGEQTFRAVCKADKRLKRELANLAKQQCRGVGIVVSPSAPLTAAMMAKTDLEFATKRKIEIVIDHYDLKSPHTSLPNMRRTLLALVKKLQEYDSLNELTVRLSDSASKTSYIHRADPHWCHWRPMPKYGRWRDFVAATTCIDGEPIVEYLLRPLLNLPVCNKVCITPQRGLVELPFGAGFDKDYMDELCHELEDLLRVRNSDKPLADCWKRLTALRRRAQKTQRAYSSYRGDLWKIGEDEEAPWREYIAEDDDTYSDYL